MTCKVCNDFDPRGHVDTGEMDESSEGAELDLMIDLPELQQAKRNGCRYCSYYARLSIISCQCYRIAWEMI
jgi:hypothetical protein